VEFGIVVPGFFSHQGTQGENEVFAECVARRRAKVTNVIQFPARDEQSEFPKTRRNSIKKLGFRGMKAIFENKKSKGMHIFSTEYEKTTNTKKNR